ncbi:ATP-binding protein [Amycolatopsis sp. GM8]|uniref:ATP-binding protein n=1 Tax=Amycolatopsis sp. GM8 TaxID=2896530 RepID=UPI0027154451|nr:ATP-binding protein [Amycolatopsis sp. GM8]
MPSPSLGDHALHLSTSCLTEPAWVAAGQPLCLIGDSGTGKTHLLVGGGTAIAEGGLKVHYTTTANLVNELTEAADELQPTKVYARYDRVDLCCLDEFGYLELDKAGAKLLFQLFTDHEERRAIAINAPFSKAHMFARTCVRRCRNSTGSTWLSHDRRTGGGGNRARRRPEWPSARRLPARW